MQTIQNLGESEYVFNHFKTTKLRDKILITTEHGSWIDLTQDEYKLLQSNKINQDSHLFKKLEKKGVILTKSSIKRVISDYKNRKCQLFQGTSLHIVVPTLRCNQKCIYCHSKSRDVNESRYDMDEDTAKSVVDFIFQTPSQNVTIEFQGGEPLLNFSIVQYIIDYAQKRNKEYKKDLRLSVVTNLTKMDDDIAKYLTSIPAFGICTSLDGPKEVHDKNRLYRNGSGSYEDVIYWIKRLQEDYNYKYLNALMVTTRFSLPYWKEIIDEFVKWKFPYIWLQPLNNLGFAQDVWNKINYKPEEFVNFWKNGLEYIIQNDIKISEVMTYYILKKYFNKKDPMFLDLMSPCGAAIGQLAYDQKGDIYTCDEARMYEEFKLGNVKHNKYKEVLTSPQACALIAASTNDSYLCDNCVWKPYCGICMVCNYATQGNIIGKTSFVDDRCKILQEQFKHVFEKLLFDVKYKETFMKWSKIKFEHRPSKNLNKEEQL